MPGRDITRPRNRAARVLFVLTLMMWAGGLFLLSAQSQTASPPDESKPDSQTQNSPTQNPPAPNPKTQEQEKKLNEQGVFVLRQNVDEVLLHATVQDDKNHIVTNLE